MSRWCLQSWYPPLPAAKLPKASGLLAVMAISADQTGIGMNKTIAIDITRLFFNAVISLSSTSIVGNNDVDSSVCLGINSTYSDAVDRVPSKHSEGQVLLPCGVRLFETSILQR